MFSVSVLRISAQRSIYFIRGDQGKKVVLIRHGSPLQQLTPFRS